MNYLVLSLILGVISLAAALPWRKRFVPEIGDDAAGKTVLIAVVVMTVVYSWLGLSKLNAGQMGLMDFGIYDSMMHLMATGGGFLQDYRGGMFDHFSPVMVVLLPLYWLSDSPVQLIWFQALTMAAAGPVLYLLARGYCRSNAFPLLLTGLYFLNPYYSRIVLYDFHIECLFPLFFFGAMLAYRRRKKWLFVLLLCGSMLIKEDFAIPIAATGFYLCCFRKDDRKTGLGILIFSVVSVLLILKVYFPAVMPEGYWHYGRYPLIGADGAETWQNLCGMLARFFRGWNIVTAATVLLPFLLLPLWDWRYCLTVWFPTLMIQMMSTHFHQNVLASHYASALIAVTPVAALYGMRYFRVWMRRRKTPFSAGYWWYAGLIFAVATHICCCELPLLRYHNYVGKWEAQYHFGILSVPLRAAWHQEMDNLTLAAGQWQEAAETALPDRDGLVVVQNELFVPLLRKYRLRSLPGPEDADAYCFDRNLYSGYDPVNMINDRIMKLVKNPDYELVYHQNEILIFKRKNWK